MGKQGVVVKLDRGFPLVRLASGEEVRCEHATALVKGERVRAAIGDRVQVVLPDEHDKGIIESIEPRRTAFVRKDPAERTTGQVLAANFDTVVVVEPIVQLNRKRLERELVLAHETGARVAIVLTKVDLADAGEAQGVLDDVAALAGCDVAVMGTAAGDEASIARVRSCVPAGETAILIGKSGVGKSTLVNALVPGAELETGAVRERDGKGRHTTTSSSLFDFPGGGYVIDTPGIRSIGLADGDDDMDGETLAKIFPGFFEGDLFTCKYSNCKHLKEPGCSVREAVESGKLSRARYASYLRILSSRN